MKVITAGRRYLDIDAYAGCIAYAELLNRCGEQAIAASTAPLNESITPTIRGWGAKLVRDYKSAPDDTFVIIDLSDPEILDTFVAQERITEIIDHHMEFVGYWKQQLNVKVEIEFIGAACTLVYERWKAAGKFDEMSELSARLLTAGILDNTLNFSSSITTERDSTAYAELMKRANLGTDWPADYFGECQRSITSNLAEAVQGDAKVVEFPTLGRGRKIVTGQLVLWNAQEVVQDHLDEVIKAMNRLGDEWLMNIVSISEQHNYVLASSAILLEFLESLLGTQAVDGIITTDILWLRKEIMKADLDKNT